MNSTRLAAVLWLAAWNLPGCSAAPPPAMAAASAHSPGPNVTQSAAPLPDPSLAQLPSFPGAEGFGAQAKGGRGGEVMEVTNLEDTGPGSLRVAIEAKDPRIVVFRVAGTINLRASLTIMNPYITIAGQSAPGDGITLRAASPDVGALIEIDTHDVVIQFLTLRAGPPSAGDDMMIQSSDAHDTYNVVVDHSSMSWGVGRDLATWYDVHDITIQWNVFSEALNCSVHPEGCHSKGVLIGGYASDENKNRPGAFNISFHHNLMAHNGERNPYIKAAGVVDVVNNVAYNPFGTFSHIDMMDQLSPDLVNYIGNYYKPGPNTEVKYGIRAINAALPGQASSSREISDPSARMRILPDVNILNPDSRQFAVSVPFPSAAITTSTAFQAYDAVLRRFGGQ